MRGQNEKEKLVKSCEFKEQNEENCIVVAFKQKKYHSLVLLRKDDNSPFISSYKLLKNRFSVESKAETESAMKYFFLFCALHWKGNF